jgi:hypothetical protein
MTLRLISASLLFVAAMGLLLPPCVWAGSVQARITFANGDLVYLDAGRLAGIEPGANAEVRRDSSLIATLEIVAAADKSSSARIIEQHSLPLIGDAVTVQTSERAPTIELPASTATNPVPTIPANPVKSRPHQRSSRVTGRVSLQWYSQNDRLPQNYDISQPAVSTRLGVRSLLNTGLDVNIRWRSRKTFYPALVNRSGRPAWDHRYYELSLSYKDPASAWQFQGGRMVVGSIGGVGYLDGAYAQYRLAHSLAVGAFAGSQPDLTTTEFRSDTRKTGMCLIWNPDQKGHRDISLTLAAAGEYERAEISREFLYHQFGLNTGHWTIYESADVNLNRGWKSVAEHQTFTLVNVNANARYQFSQHVAVSAGYDGHANYRTWDTRSLSDSVFDEAMRRGYRGGLELVLPYQVRVDLRENLRDEPGTGRLYLASAASAMTHNIMRGRFGLTARFDEFENRFTAGQQASASASWTTPLHGDLSLQVGKSSYDYRATQTHSTSDWWRISLDATLLRHAYVSSYYESYVGTSEDVGRIYVETGYRF